MEIKVKAVSRQAYFVVGAHYDVIEFVAQGYNSKGEIVKDKNGNSIPAVKCQETFNGVKTREIYIFPMTLSSTVTMVEIGANDLVVPIVTDDAPEGVILRNSGTLVKKYAEIFSANIKDDKETEKKGEEIWYENFVKIIPKGFDCVGYDPHLKPLIWVKGFIEANGRWRPSCFKQDASQGYDDYTLNITI